MKSYKFDLQGHRGARGILPENSLPAFQKAVDLGVNTLELDVVISKDSLVVVSHEAYMNPEICLDPNGEKIKDQTAYNLYNMTYEEIKSFDCGSLVHPDFPDQTLAKTHKPLLTEVIKLSTEHLRDKGKRVGLNIELKSSPKTDNVFHPSPQVFVDLVVKSIKEELIPLNKITIQSFDKRVIQYVKDNYPQLAVAYLVEQGNFYDNLQSLERTPDIYSPQYGVLDSLDIKQAHDSGVKVIPWTVNDISDMKTLLEMGVDGLITDYPNKAKVLHKS
ncbi:MAG: glycerophosphodiester phosphodiesterase [Psychroflexus sp.]|nr:glycerophosphodiester phosphodiesterase [Psychroflexus sp.]